MPKIFSYPNLSADFHFAHSPRDFVVSEIPLYEFSGSGEHQILQIRKKGLSTFELVKILSSYIACPAKSIGYAGLKDKNATTTQYLSIPKIYFKQKDIQSCFEAISKQYDIKLLSTTLHNNKIKTGHLKGNRFFIRLKKVTPINAKKIESSLKIMQNFGFANFFGFQRFGLGGDNYKLGFDLANADLARGSLARESFENGDLKGEDLNDFALKSYKPKIQAKIPKNKKMRDFLRSSLQSYLFNEWLCVRLLLGRFGEFGFGEFIEAIREVKEQKHIWQKSKEQESKKQSSELDFLDTLQNKAFANLFSLSRQNLREIYENLQNQKMPFGLLNGDICCHYPYGRFFVLEGVDSKQIDRFQAGEFAPTGALNGENLKQATGIASLLESPFLEVDCRSGGSRRYAWVWASECESSYKESKAQMELHFSLPSGAYATTMLEQIAGKEL